MFGTLKYESVSSASKWNFVKSKFSNDCLKAAPSGPKQANAISDKERAKKIILFSRRYDTVETKN